jgi:uncharacterized protein (TIRG00374 family)
VTDKRQNQIKRVVSAVLTIVLLIVMGVFLYRNKDVFSSLRNLKYYDILLIALLQPITIGTVALTNKLVIDHIYNKISFSDALLLQFANNFLNKIIAEGGSVYRGGYLKAQYSFPLSKYISSVGGIYIIGLMTNSIMGILLLLLIYLTEHLFNIYVFAVFLAITAGTFLLIIIKPSFNNKNWFFRKVNQVLDGWNSIKSSKRLLFYIFILSALGAFTSAVSTFIAYRGLNADIKFVNSILYSSISTMANFVNLTPGGLGVNEAVLVFSSEVIGLSGETILLGALLLRAITLIISFLFGGLSYLILNFRLVKTQKN